MPGNDVGPGASRSPKMATGRDTLPMLARQFRAAGRRVWASARRLPAPFALMGLISSATHTAAPTAAPASHNAPVASADMRPLPPAPRPAQARIILNPTSGSGRGAALLREIEATVAWLDAHSVVAEVTATTGPGSARVLAEEAVRMELPLVVAAGGDGTINEVVQALVGHTTALGVLPLGTVNVWAREMNIPLGLADAREVLVRGVRRRIDVGRANARYFLLMAGIGIDAEVTRRVERHWLKRFGLKLLDYVAMSGYIGVTQRPARVSVRRGVHRRSAHAVQILIGNTRLWGGALELTQRALADDGWLDVVYVGGHHLRHRISVFMRAALRRPSLGPGARYERVRTLHLDAATPLPVQVDGELIGYLPMTFVVMPRALTVVVPRGAPSDLFIHPPLED